MPAHTPPADYFPRRLRPNSEGLPRIVDEEGILAVPGARVVLGEPGMGKSELLKELGRRLGTKPTTAIHFLNRSDPRSLVVPGKPLLIDGLDEAMARREGDAIDAVLARLEDAGSPPFVLSCRSREWQARGQINLKEIYGHDPQIFNIEPLDRAEAGHFLSTRHPSVDAESVLEHLDEHGLSELYRNPLTLNQVGRVAGAGSDLPSSRGALFEQICSLIWTEHNQGRQDGGLAQLTESQALAASGAICAALLLGGAEAASNAGALELQQGDLRLAEIRCLPGADVSDVVFGSKLFQSLGPARIKPLHRVVAEYLGARWLAQQANTPRTQRRLLAQFHGGGTVPASLRGLHAWLAYHNPALSLRVISADPYGVLRYGETAKLLPSEALSLFDALIALAKNNPWFRAGDWDSHTANGLMIPALQAQIEAVISSETSNTHLRSLLIEGLKDTHLASDLADRLAEIVLSPSRFYSERYDAACALLPHRDRDWWLGAIQRLTEEPDEDGGRLACRVIALLDADVPDELLVAAIFAELELFVCAWSRTRKRRSRSISYFGDLVPKIKTARLPSTLDLLAEFTQLLLPNSHKYGSNDIGYLGADLIVRAIDEGIVGADDGERMWRWLGIIEARHTALSKDRESALRERLRANPALRHSIQEHALSPSHRTDTLWSVAFDLQHRLVGLWEYESDIVWFLEQLAPHDNQDPILREDWCDLMRIGHSASGFAPGVREAAEGFMRSDKELADFIAKLEVRRIPPWELREQRNSAKRERKRRITFEARRREFEENREYLIAGDRAWTYDPARVYLGFLHALPHEASCLERLNHWLGPTLAADALTGFEAVLFRDDIPSALDVSQAISRSTDYTYSFMILAALLERLRTNRGFGDIPPDVLTTGLVLVHAGYCRENDTREELEKVLETLVLSTQEHRESYAKILMEPALAAHRQHVIGLYKLSRDSDWQETGIRLAERWLLTYSDLPDSVEGVLVNCLAYPKQRDRLAYIAEQRSARSFRDYDHMRRWLAIDLLVRFDVTHVEAKGIGTDDPSFIWLLRDLFQQGKHGAMLPVSTAQAHWIFREFRSLWPYATINGASSGDTNDYDATDFLRSLAQRLADDTSEEASAALSALIASPSDTYTDTLRHLAAEQRQKRAEVRFQPLSPPALGAIFDNSAPANIEDLKALVVEELETAGKKLIGDDIDSVRNFWDDNGIPREENRCRDQLAKMITPELGYIGIQRITEADMPKTKRADLAFAHSTLQLPMEVKGQWHQDVWDAAGGQLDARYLIDWRSEQRGIYCVLWFGELPSASGRRLKAPPDGIPTPSSAEEMKEALVSRLPEGRRTMIDIVVIDLSKGKSDPA